MDWQAVIALGIALLCVLYLVRVWRRTWKTGSAPGCHGCAFAHKAPPPRPTQRANSK